MLAVLLTALSFLRAHGDIAEMRSKTDALFAEWNRDDSPGCALAIYKDGAIVYEHGYGAASLELSVPITPKTVFDIGSTSKQFTATCIALLAQDGKLKLDDEIGKFLPEMPKGSTPITIRHLLNHTSGLRDYIELMLLAGIREQDRTTSAEAYAAITRQKTQNFAPGEKHLYSNTGYFLLAQIVERVSKKSLREFAAERIFGPLGMTHTEILDDSSHVVRGRANSYEPEENGFASHTSDWEQTGDGAVQTSVEDLQRWDENFYSGKVGGTALNEMLLTRGKLDDGTVLDYCAGLMVGEHRGLKTVSHGGAWVGFRAELLRFPAQHVSVACLCNLGSMDPSSLARRVAEVWLSDEMNADKATTTKPAVDSRKAVEVPASELSACAGLYLHEDLVVHVELHEGRLSVSGTSVRPGALTPVGHNRFRREGGGRALDLVFEKGGMRFEFTDGARWSFTSIQPWTPSATDLQRFVGTYWSDEIGAELKLEIVEGALRIAGHRTLSGLAFTPLAQDQFSSDLGRIAFEVDSDKVKSFVIDGNRAKGLKYVRR